MNKSHTGRAYAAALLYAFIIGFSFMFVKLALSASHPLDTLAHRFTISLLAAAAALFITGRRIRFDLKGLLAIIPAALFYPFLFFAFQTFGLVYTTSAEAGIIHALVPIFTMVLATIFLKERSTWIQKLFTLLTVAGVVFIFVMKGVQLNASSLLGVALVLLSAISSAAYSVLARKLTQQYHLLDITFIMSLIGFISFNLISVARHTVEGTLTHYFDPFTSPSFIWAMVYLGLFSSLGSSLLSNYALSKIEASKMSLFNNVGTIITMFGGAVFLNEELAYYHLVGAVMVIGGIIGAAFSKQVKGFFKI
ncbi:DMT family transporter [Paenibacillus sp. GCM10027626]|uniref:DMT family transporter n=1 Tax=Paenibacillus sp. GCM10027626 TaxID=3273411 RepID=UPI003641EA84